MPPSLKWAFAGLACGLAGMVCVVKSGFELDKEVKAADPWRQIDLSDTSESSFSPSLPPRPESSQTGPDSSMPSLNESD